MLVFCYNDSGDMMDISTWVTTFIEGYQAYALWIILLFAILHPLTENPWSLLSLTLAITFVGIPVGYGIIFIGTVIGILLLYLIMHSIRLLSHDALLHKRGSKAILNWINDTQTWRHIIVIGMPAIPTYPIKIALPLSKMTFSKFFITLLSSYIFLYIANSLLYFGVLGIVTNNIPKPLAILLLTLFALYIYFGKSLRHKEANNIEVSK